MRRDATVPQRLAAGPPTAGARWADRLYGSDLALNRAALAARSTGMIGAAIAAEWLFVRLTMAAPPNGRSALGLQQYHQALMIAVLLGGIVGLTSAFWVSENSVRGEILSALTMAAPITGGLALTVWLAGDHALSLVVLAAVTAGYTYCGRLGPRGLLAGAGVFMGAVVGYALHGAVPGPRLGWLAAEIGVGVVSCLLVRLLVFPPHPANALQRAERTYTARARRVAPLALAAFEEGIGPEGRASRRLRAQLARLTEAALLVDARLALPGALTGDGAAQRLRRQLLDIELRLANTARFAQALARLDLPGEQAALVGQALRCLADRDYPGTAAAAAGLRQALTGQPAGGSRVAMVVVHRFAGTITRLTDVLAERAEDGPAPGSGSAFTTPVGLVSGRLPGSAPASARVPARAWAGRGGQLRLPADVRRIIQMAVAAALAAAAGGVVSERRVYWALIAVLVIFIGVNNTREQVGKALLRAAGTLAGVAVGSILAPVTGPHAGWAIAVVLGAFFLGFYFLQINYAFFVAGLTVAIAQLYAQLGELSSGLLLLRLTETSIGALAAVVAVLVVFPVRTRQAFRLALRDHLAAFSSLVEQAVGQLGREPVAVVPLHQAVRAFDQAHHSLLATAAPLRRRLFARASWRVEESVRLAEAYGDYARSLVSDLESADRLPPDARSGLAEAGRVLGTSIEALQRALAGQPGPPYRPSAARFELIEQQLETAAGALHDGQLAVRDLQRIDEIMAEFAAHEAVEIAGSCPAGRARRPVSRRPLDPCRRPPLARPGAWPRRASHQGA